MNYLLAIKRAEDKCRGRFIVPIAARLPTPGSYTPSIPGTGQEAKHVVTVQPYKRYITQRGLLLPAGYGDLNYVTWWTIKNKSICLLGPERSTLPFEVTWQDVLETMRDNLNGYWASKAKHPYLFLLDGWIVIAAATLCRILTTIEEEEIMKRDVKQCKGSSHS